MEALGSAQHLEVAQLEVSTAWARPGLGAESSSPEKYLLAKGKLPTDNPRAGSGVLSCEQEPQELRVRRWENLGRE